MNSKLFFKVIEREERMAGIKSFLIFSVAAFNFTVVTWCIGPNQLVMDAQSSSSPLKEGRQVTLAVGKAVGKLKAIVCLDTLHPDAAAGIPLDQPFEEVRGRIRRLFWISRKKTHTGKLINSGILVKLELWIRNTTTGNHLNIDLNPLTGICHLLVRLWLISVLRLTLREHSKLTHDTE